MTRQEAGRKIDRKLAAHDSRQAEKSLARAQPILDDRTKRMVDGVRAAKRLNLQSLDGEPQEMGVRALKAATERADRIQKAAECKMREEFVQVMNDMGEWCPWFIDIYEPSKGDVR